MTDDSTGSKDQLPSESPAEYEATGEALRESRERRGVTSPGQQAGTGAPGGGVPAGTEGEEHFPGGRDPVGG